MTKYGLTDDEDVGYWEDEQDRQRGNEAAAEEMTKRRLSKMVDTTDDRPLAVKYIGFIAQFNEMAERCHQTSKDKGFYDGGKFNDAEKIALMHSELSECLEAMRDGNPTDAKLPAFSNGEIELADAVIRIMDYAAAKGFNVGGAIVAKAAFNQGRPHKHGRKF